jgi:hypothetical protein
MLTMYLTVFVPQNRCMNAVVGELTAITNFSQRCIDFAEKSDLPWLAEIKGNIYKAKQERVENKKLSSEDGGLPEWGHF